MGFGINVLKDKLTSLQANMTDLENQRDDLFAKIADINDQMAKCQGKCDSLVSMIAALEKLNLGGEEQ